jgi:hypothetical protein
MKNESKEKFLRGAVSFLAGIEFSILVAIITIKAFTLISSNFAFFIGAAVSVVLIIIVGRVFGRIWKGRNKRAYWSGAIVGSLSYYGR